MIYWVFRAINTTATNHVWIIIIGEREQIEREDPLQKLILTAEPINYRVLHTTTTHKHKFFVSLYIKHLNTDLCHVGYFLFDYLMLCQCFMHCLNFKWGYVNSLLSSTRKLIETDICKCVYGSNLLCLSGNARVLVQYLCFVVYLLY